jgi:hypothetical protein
MSQLGVICRKRLDAARWHQHSSSVFAFVEDSHDSSSPFLWILGRMEHGCHCHLLLRIFVKDDVGKTPDYRFAIVLVDELVDFWRPSDLFQTRIHTTHKILPQSASPSLVPVIRLTDILLG